MRRVFRSCLVSFTMRSLGPRVSMSWKVWFSPAMAQMNDQAEKCHGVTGDRPRLFLHIAQNRSSTIGSAHLRGRPGAPRRPSAREICSVNCESPSSLSDYPSAKPARFTMWDKKPDFPGFLAFPRDFPSFSLTAGAIRPCVLNSTPSTPGSTRSARWSRPRVRNWRKPITDLMMPKTGSTVCLRNA
jgi:hypothetical protein